MSEFIDPRDGISYPFTLLSEGDTTKVWHSPDTDFVVIENTDLVIPPDGRQEMEVDRKGWYATQISNICFGFLSDKNVSNHFLWPNTGSQGHTFAARPLHVPPVRAVVRNQPYGSYLARHPDIDPSESFPEPVVEFFEENIEFGNPLLVVNQERETVSRFRADRPQSAEDSFLGEWHIRELGHLMVDKWEKATEVALSAALALRKAWELGDAKLVDMEITWGVDEQNRVAIGGTIGPESWRLWRNGDPEDPLDQQLFREAQTPSDIIEPYRTILIEAMQWLPARGGGGNTGNQRRGGGGNTGNHELDGGGGMGNPS